MKTTQIERIGIWIFARTDIVASSSGLSVTHHKLLRQFDRIFRLISLRACFYRRTGGIRWREIVPVCAFRWVHFFLPGRRQAGAKRDVFSSLLFNRQGGNAYRVITELYAASVLRIIIRKTHRFVCMRMCVYVVYTSRFVIRETAPIRSRARNFLRKNRETTREIKQQLPTTPISVHFKRQRYSTLSRREVERYAGEQKVSFTAQKQTIKKGTDG